MTITSIPYKTYLPTVKIGQNIKASYKGKFFSAKINLIGVNNVINIVTGDKSYFCNEFANGIYIVKNKL